jgi:hypothetical protein
MVGCRWEYQHFPIKKGQKKMMCDNATRHTVDAN